MEVTLINELKRMSRRLEDIAKNQDKIFSDREILEDILTRQTAVENALHMQRANQTEMVKNIKADIGEVKDTVEAKIDEATVTIDEKTVIVKSPQETVIEKIKNRLKGR